MDGPLMFLLLWMTLGRKAICSPQFVRTVQYDELCYTRPLLVWRGNERFI